RVPGDPAPRRPATAPRDPRPDPPTARSDGGLYRPCDRTVCRHGVAHGMGARSTSDDQTRSDARVRRGTALRHSARSRASRNLPVRVALQHPPNALSGPLRARKAPERFSPSTGRDDGSEGFLVARFVVRELEGFRITSKARRSWRFPGLTVWI